MIATKVLLEELNKASNISDFSACWTAWPLVILSITFEAYEQNVQESKQYSLSVAT
jgi:hypothetical protein